MSEAIESPRLHHAFWIIRDNEKHRTRDFKLMEKHGIVCPSSNLPTFIWESPPLLVHSFLDSPEVTLKYNTHSGSAFYVSTISLAPKSTSQAPAPSCMRWAAAFSTPWGVSQFFWDRAPESLWVEMYQPLYCHCDQIPGTNKGGRIYVPHSLRGCCPWFIYWPVSCDFS